MSSKHQQALVARKRAEGLRRIDIWIAELREEKTGSRYRADLERDFNTKLDNIKNTINKLTEEYLIKSKQIKESNHE